MKVNLGRPYIKPEIVLEEIEKALETRWISGGPTIGKFEEAVKEYNKDKDGRYIAVANGTVALEMALKILNNGKTWHKREDNEVIVPSWSWVASGFAASLVGAKPVWCDVNIYGVPDVHTIEEKITDKTGAIIVVHQMGVPCDMDKINQLAEDYNIPVIEDGACAIGSEYKGIRLGNMEYSDNIFTYSFQARKVLTTGEGGMIVTRHEEEEEMLRAMRAFSTNIPPLKRDDNKNVVKEYFDKFSGNYKLSDIASAVGIAHLKYVDEEIEKRRVAGEYYNFHIEEMRSKGFPVKVANLIPDYCTKYNWQNYHILLHRDVDRDKIVGEMKKRGVGCKWDIQAIHREPVYHSNEKLVSTDTFHNHGMWLPFFAEITKEEQDYVIDTLADVLNSGE